jgi:hypothetical protein
VHHPAKNASKMENPDDFLKQFELPSGATTTVSPRNQTTSQRAISSPKNQAVPELPARKLNKTPSQASMPPDLPPRKLKQTESSHSVLSVEDPPSAAAATGKKPRRKTSFLEMLLKEKAEKGDLNLEAEAYMELVNGSTDGPALSKQELEDKIRRIAQAGAQGSNTTAMGIGLRDLGYAVAKSRQASSTESSASTRIRVRDIASKAEEMVQIQRKERESSSYSHASYQPPIHPNARNLMIEPIGEVSEGASQSIDYTHQDSMKSGARHPQPSYVNGGKRGQKNLDKFFGSMRLSFQQKAKKSQTKSEQVIAQMKVKYGELVEFVKEQVERVKQKVKERRAQGQARHYYQQM